MAIERRRLEHRQASEKPYFTTGEIARHFGVTTKTVSNWCDAGRLPCVVTPSGHRRIPVSAVKGGREALARWQAANTMLAEAAAGLPSPSDGEIAEQVLARRHGRAARD